MSSLLKIPGKLCSALQQAATSVKNFPGNHPRIFAAGVAAAGALAYYNLPASCFASACVPQAAVCNTPPTPTFLGFKALGKMVYGAPAQVCSAPTICPPPSFCQNVVATVKDKGLATALAVGVIGALSALKNRLTGPKKTAVEDREPAEAALSTGERTDTPSDVDALADGLSSPASSVPSASAGDGAVVPPQAPLAIDAAATDAKGQGLGGELTAPLAADEAVDLDAAPFIRDEDEVKGAGAVVRPPMKALTGSYFRNERDLDAIIPQIARGEFGPKLREEFEKAPTMMQLSTIPFLLTLKRLKDSESYESFCREVTVNRDRVYEEFFETIRGSESYESFCQNNPGAGARFSERYYDHVKGFPSYESYLQDTSSIKKQFPEAMYNAVKGADVSHLGEEMEIQRAYWDRFSQAVATDMEHPLKAFYYLCRMGAIPKTSSEDITGLVSAKTNEYTAEAREVVQTVSDATGAALTEMIKRLVERMSAYDPHHLDGGAGDILGLRMIVRAPNFKDVPIETREDLLTQAAWNAQEALVCELMRSPRAVDFTPNTLGEALFQCSANTCTGAVELILQHPKSADIAAHNILTAVPRLAQTRGRADKAYNPEGQVAALKSIIEHPSFAKIDLADRRKVIWEAINWYQPKGGRDKVMHDYLTGVFASLPKVPTSLGSFFRRSNPWD